MHRQADVENENRALREQVRTLTEQLTASEERGRMILDAKNDMLDSVRAQARTLTAERDEARKQSEQYAAALMDAGEALGVRAVSATTVATEARALRARVAELEADVQMWRDATECLGPMAAREALATARDAALEEAAQRVDATRGDAREAADMNCALVLGQVARDVRALKAQPARRFLEAERVASTLQGLAHTVRDQDKAHVLPGHLVHRLPLSMTEWRAIADLHDEAAGEVKP